MSGAHREDPAPVVEVPTSKGSFRIRPAGPGDAELVRQFIQALAAYEGAGDRCTVTVDRIRESFFGSSPRAEAVVGHLGGEPAGFAVFFPHYSTYRGQTALYLEDLFVKPEHRGAGLGRILLAYLASVALRRDWFRVDWTGLAWNEPAFAFYSRLGAELDPDRRSFHLEGEALRRLAADLPRLPGPRPGR